MKHLPIMLLVAGLAWAIPKEGQAQLMEVKQTVFGMDCAPCAYALENRMNKLEGVTSASVSLNDGLLTAELAEENTLTLRQIRKSVEESGFSPREAEISVKGTLRKRDDRQMIVTPSDEEYMVRFSNEEAENRLKSVADGETVTLSGRVDREEEETEYWTLAVGSL